ncbi:MAG: hypothetical protein JKY20_10010 [Alphaproteobacteria bacterium]|nr:hypothetical protein [Alphaproteobacteria bacterium]
MNDHTNIIQEAYRAALADWANRDLHELPQDGNLIEVTASLASTFARINISTQDVLVTLSGNI